MRKLALLSAISAIALATPAYARDGAWYVGGDFGAMIVEDTDFDIGASENVIALDHEYGFDGALFVGYDLGAFRIEAEVAYKKADVDSFVSEIDLPGASPGERDFPNGEGSTSALSFMINGMLDFGDDDGLSGFVGAGGGIARVKYNNLRVFDNTAPFLDESDSKFAWQIFAGVRQAVSDNIDITVKYRFFNVNGPSGDWLHPGPFDGERIDSRWRSHSLLGGITFNFGAPPQ
jgi:opacity protein-like surface antigen